MARKGTHRLLHNRGIRLDHKSVEKGEKSVLKTRQWYDRPTPSFERALWVIGHTSSGKSTYAKKIAENAGIFAFEAGAWVRENCDKNASTEELTEYAQKTLKEQPRFSALKIQRVLTSLSENQRIIISGARNPFDFVTNFDHKLDSVVFLGMNRFPAKTTFEHLGIITIREYIDFLIETEQIEKSQKFEYEP